VRYKERKRDAILHLKDMPCSLFLFTGKRETYSLILEFGYMGVAPKIGRFSAEYSN
jgi:hypothetical protein